MTLTDISTIEESHSQSQVICVMSLGGINTLVVDLIGQRNLDVDCLSVKPCCYWL